MYCAESGSAKSGIVRKSFGCDQVAVSGDAPWEARAEHMRATRCDYSVLANMRRLSELLREARLIPIEIQLSLPWR